jgi:hypothetical protein
MWQGALKVSISGSSNKPHHIKITYCNGTCNKTKFCRTAWLDSITFRRFQRRATVGGRWNNHQNWNVTQMIPLSAVLSDDTGSHVVPSRATCEKVHSFPFRRLTATSYLSGCLVIGEIPTCRGIESSSPARTSRQSGKTLPCTAHRI